VQDVNNNKVNCVVGVRGTWECFTFCFEFVHKPKTYIKNKVYYKKEGKERGKKEMKWGVLRYNKMLLEKKMLLDKHKGKEKDQTCLSLGHFLEYRNAVARLLL
jgi:hypothetical protein